MYRFVYFNNLKLRIKGFKFSIFFLQKCNKMYVGFQ